MTSAEVSFVKNSLVWANARRHKSCRSLTCFFISAEGGNPLAPKLLNPEWILLPEL